MGNPEIRVAVSAISFWEVSLKSSIGKMELEGFSPEDLPDYCRQVGFDIIELSAEVCSTYHRLKSSFHKDPFDRMLIWEAISHNYTIISADANIKKYSVEGLKVL